MKGYHHLDQDKRSQIAALMNKGYSMRQIAKDLNLNVSTISREIKRNKSQEYGYDPKLAEKRAQRRRSQASSEPKKLKGELLKKVTDCINLEWSPEQIAGRLKLEGVKISHKSIYRMIGRDRKAGGMLYLRLRHGGKKYKKRPTSDGEKTGIPNRKDISERPNIIEEKIRKGDWEGDTIIGAEHKGAVATYVDRASKYTVLCLLKAGKKADGLAKATIKRMKKLPHPVLTITYDNGREFCSHELIAKTLKAQCYFARPYHSWERGLNEHTNGLIRQYLPKHMDLRQVTQKNLTNIENALNHRPRKVLNYKTPHEVFFSQYPILDCCA